MGESLNNWVFTWEEIQQTPSRKDGVTWEAEKGIRHNSCIFILEMGKYLRRGKTDNTAYIRDSAACVLFHRFFMAQSFKSHNRLVSRGVKLCCWDHTYVMSFFCYWWCIDCFCYLSCRLICSPGGYYFDLIDYWRSVLVPCWKNRRLQSLTLGNCSKVLSSSRHGTWRECEYPVVRRHAYSHSHIGSTVHCIVLPSAINWISLVSIHLMVIGY